MATNTTETNDLRVLDEEGLAELTKEIFKSVNERIDERIAIRLCQHSDDDHVPSAKTVYEAIQNFAEVKYVVVTSGNINEANLNPDPEVIYVLRRSTKDTVATLYVWNESTGFINCGGVDVSPDVNFASIPGDVIADIVADSYCDTDPGLDNSNTGKIDLLDDDDEHNHDVV